MLTIGNLSGLPRLAPLPWRVIQLGCSDTENAGRQNFYFADSVEICLRLSDDACRAADIIEGRRFEVPLPHAYVKYPFRKFSFDGLNNRNAVHFRYDLETLAELRRYDLLPAPDFPYVILELTPRFNGLLVQFRELLRLAREPGSADRIDALGLELLQEINFQRRRAGRTPDPERDRILAVASQLLYDPDGLWSLDEIIRRHGFSRRSFYRHWKRCFDETPAVYVMREKLRTAARELIDSDRRISEISRRIGLRDAAYFSKVFRRYYGVTPLVYRLRRLEPSRKPPDSGPEKTGQ